MEVNEAYQIPDKMWKRIDKLIPKHRHGKEGGRPRMDDRKAMNAIFYVLRTGCQWKALPKSLGASSTVHDRFTEWRKAGVFAKMWKAGLSEYDEKKGLIRHGNQWTGPLRRPPWVVRLRDQTRRTGQRKAPKGA
jgi:putative transposase